MTRDNRACSTAWVDSAVRDYSFTGKIKQRPFDLKITHQVYDKKF